MNRLSRETSPYLKQHQDNPVDWHPWGAEALELARASDKPIFLSVGYSACHWCHVMAHECFENPEIAALMNELFVNIKVDREERPDLDQLYQPVAQAITRSGGWPLSVFLTPEGKPFFGGTYFPPEDRYGRPGFTRVLRALAEAYRADRAGLDENANRLTAMIASLEQLPELGEKDVELAGLQEAGRELLRAMDPVEGGLGGAPKFPNPVVLSYLWRIGHVALMPEARDAVLLTLRKMAAGGIYDHLGGAFHRYSVDEHWTIPHFEKMLYDNGLLLKLYAEALLLDDPLVDPDTQAQFLDVLEGTVEYLRRELELPEGGFMAAQDADSEGAEGKYYSWTPSQLRNLLSGPEFGAVSELFDVREEGNFEHGLTVLQQRIPFTPELRGLWDAARAKLLAERSKRVPPSKDDKLLVSWNGLAISGLAWAGAALERGGRPQAATAAREGAVRAFEAVLRAARREDGRLFATVQQGQPKHNGYLDDYAFLALAALDLERFGLRDGGVGLARSWMGMVFRHFRDQSAGYWFTSDDHEALIQRPRNLLDQAIPSGTAVTLGVCLALAEEAGLGEAGDGAGPTADELRQEAERQLRALVPVAERNPYSCSELLSAALLRLVGPVWLKGPGASQACRHPLVFGRAAGGAVAVLCHRQTCISPADRGEVGAEALWQEARKRVIRT